MNPQDLIGPSSALGNPVPFWFITVFRVLGFTLHMIPMNIWFAGMLLIAVFAAFGRNNSKLLARRLARSTPVIVAVGINLGIIPLLFTQVGYYQFFYPAGVLIGWPWISVIFLLAIAYYGVYAYSLDVRKNPSGESKFAIASAWVSSILFIVIGFLFANNFSLMVNVREWIHIFNRTNVGGAPSGLALNVSDPSLIPRWLMMFGIAVMTTSVYIAIDATFMKNASTAPEYKSWSGKFTFRLFTLGMMWFAVMGSWYIFGTLYQHTKSQVWQNPLMVAIFGLTAVSPGAVRLALLLQQRMLNRRLVIAAGVAQLVVIALNAISRQWVQNVEISRFENVSSLPVNIQWSPMIVFLLLFVLGFAVVAWMIAKIVSVERVAAQGRQESDRVNQPSWSTYLLIFRLSEILYHFDEFRPSLS